MSKDVSRIIERGAVFPVVLWQIFSLTLIMLQNDGCQEPFDFGSVIQDV